MIKFSNQHSTIEEIEQFYFHSLTSLNYYFDEKSGYFIGYSRTELHQERKDHLRCLERMISLEFLTLLEASFKIDYLIRRQKKLKDELSKSLRKIYNQKGTKASLVDDILKAWKASYPANKPLIDKFQKALDYRNWLAHGRYWEPKIHPHLSEYDYLSVQLLASTILREFDLKKL